MRRHRLFITTLSLILAGALGACGSNVSPPPDVAIQDGPLAADKGFDAGPAPDSAAPDAAPPRHNGPLFRRSSSDGELAAFKLDHIVVNGSGELELKPAGGLQGKDPYAPGTFNGGNYYNGGSYRYGKAQSTTWVGKHFDVVVPSFEGSTPKGTWIVISLAVRVSGAWSADYVMGVWASSTETVARHSVDGQDDATAKVSVDSLLLKKKADALRYTVQLFSDSSATPRVRAVAAVAKDSSAAAPADVSTPAARGKLLDVPRRTQVLPGASGWCSPTSTSMVEAYWSKKLGKPALDETVPTAAAGIYDWVYDGTGNWPFNTAHASVVGGGLLHAFVTRVWSMNQIERLIAADIPVVISINFGSGELTGAPISSTPGHIIVVRGFTKSGDVVCNDPAFASEAAVKVTYKRVELEAALNNSYGTIYVIWPVGKVLPVDPLGAF